MKNNNKDKRKQEMESCDTFVVMSDLTASGDVIFGKNSDRPVGEVQEVVRIPAKNYQEEITLQVSTYLLTYTIFHKERRKFQIVRVRCVLPSST